MDIQRPSNAKAKKIKRALYVTVAVVVIAGVTLGLSRLKPAAPSVDRGTVWTDTVKRGPMLREVRGLGTLVPLDIHWIAALTTARVDKIVIRPGHLVEPNTVILEMSDPAVAQTLIDSQFQMKGAEADLANLRVQVNSELMNQKAIEAGVRSDYEQAKLQHEVDVKLFNEGIDADVTQKLSKVREDQLKIRLDSRKNAPVYRPIPRRPASRLSSLTSNRPAQCMTCARVKPTPCMFAPASPACCNCCR